MYYSPTLIENTEGLFSPNRLALLSKEQRIEVTKTILSHLFGLCDYTAYTKLTFLRPTERKAIRLAIKECGFEIFQIKLAILASLHPTEFKGMSAAAIFEGFGLDRNDAKLVRAIETMGIAKKIKARLKDIKQPLSIKYARALSGEIITGLTRAFTGTVRRDLSYVFKSQGLPDTAFVSQLKTRALLAFYSYYPFYSLDSLTRALAQSGINYVENIREHYAIPSRTRIIEGDDKGPGIYTTTSINTLMEKEDAGAHALGDLNIGNSMVHNGKRQALGFADSESVSEVISRMSYERFVSKLGPTKQRVFNVLMLNDDLNFLAYFHREYGVQTEHTADILEMSKNDNRFFLEALRQYFGLGHNSFYAFIAEVGEAFAVTVRA